MNTEFHPLVSIVIPVYNGSNYLREAIDSALAQTYDNIEILVINDGSDDNGATEAIAKSYGDKIRYYSKENGGVATALNMGIENMRGEYFSWLSHDDVYLSDKIEVQIKEAERGGKFIFGAYEVIGTRGEHVADVFPNISFPTHNPRFYLYRGLIHGCTTLIHKSIFDNYGHFDIEKKTTQDYYYWNKILKNITPVYIEKLLCKSREHPDRGTHKEIFHNEEADKLWIEMLEDLNEHDCMSMMASSYAFYNSTAYFLSNTQMFKAAALAKRLAKDHELRIDEQVEKTKVSIIIPFFNRIEQLKGSLLSAIAQRHKNIEIILINDGSTDSLDTIQDIINNNYNIRLINQKNQGASVARNRGIMEASGDYITFLDSDDEFMPELLTTILSSLFKDGCLAAHTSYYNININTHEQKIIHSGEFSGNVYPDIINTCPIATSGLTVRKDLVSSDLFPPKIALSEDTIAKIKIAYQTKILGIDFPLLKIYSGIDYSECYYQLRGSINILNFVINDKNFYKAEKNIKKLVILISTYIDCGGTYAPYQRSKYVKMDLRNLSHMARLKNFYCTYGLGKTIIKIVEKCFKKIKLAVNISNLLL